MGGTTAAVAWCKAPVRSSRWTSSRHGGKLHPMMGRGSVGMLANGGLLSCAGALLSCAAALGDPELDEAALHDTAGAPVIVTLQTREGSLTITSAGGHVRYRLPGVTAGSEGMTLEELEGRDPVLSELLRRATADGAPGWVPFLDASRGVLPVEASVVGVPAIDASRGGSQRLRSR